MEGMTQEERARELGMMSEPLTGRSMQEFFEPTEEENLVYPWAPVVDTEKKTEIDTDSLTSREVNTKIRELMDEGYGTIRLLNPRGKHSLAVGILSRVNIEVEGCLLYTSPSPRDQRGSRMPSSA